MPSQTSVQHTNHTCPFALYANCILSMCRPLRCALSVMDGTECLSVCDPELACMLYIDRTSMRYQAISGTKELTLTHPRRVSHKETEGDSHEEFTHPCRNCYEGNPGTLIRTKGVYCAR